MNFAKRRPAQYASTIGMDYSVRYPCDFTALSISPYGRDVVLAGRAGLAIVDVEYPLSPPRTVPIRSLWKIANVAWCPSTVHHGWVGTAVNQTLLIHDLAHNTETPMRVLKSHPMAITDIAWVPQIPSWIGTASIDPVIKIWDVRRDQKPVWYYSEWEPADLLAFNNVHMHKMASVHRNKIALWDIRFGSSPLMTMDEAHGGNITSISWHPTREDTIVSASQDGTVKRWSIEQNSPAEDYCHSFAHEVLGASYLPFGEGLLVTQRSHDNRIAIIRDSAQSAGAIVHEFVGHTGAVHGTVWRSYGKTGSDGGGGGDKPDHQLVTWGQDQVLRMWAIDDDVVEAVGGKSGTACVARNRYLEVPSFATNYLGPDRILHLVQQKRLADELMAAAFVPDLDGHDTRNSSNAQLVISPEALPAAEAMARGTIDEHSSDDGDDDEYGRTHGAAAQFAGWQEEVAAIAGGKYRATRTVAIKETGDSEGQCRLLVGVPWLTRDTLVLRIAFPPHYPAFAADYMFEAVGAAYGDTADVHERLVATAEAYAARDAGSLDQCLHVLLLHLVQAVRLRSPYTRNRHLRMEDIDRLPPAPPPLPPLPTTHARRRRLSRVHVMADSAASPWSDDGVSLDSRGSASAGDNDGDNNRESANDEDDDEEETYSGDNDVDGLFADYGKLGAPAGLGGLSKTLHHANARDRLDSNTPFPRLCGGTFSGAGVLVCFFASIYTPDTYPGDATWERNRREMGQQLRALTKLRSLDSLSYYTRMVRFGLEHRGAYLPPDDGAIAARDEDAPRYYFRPSVAAGRATPPSNNAADGPGFFRTRSTRSETTGGGVGNSVVVCAAPEDRTASADLARQLLVVGGPTAAWMCGHNATVYALAGNARMASVWTLVACLAAPSAAASAHPWAVHPPVRAWLATVMRRLERRGDAQALALLACVLSPVLSGAGQNQTEPYAADGGGGIERIVEEEAGSQEGAAKVSDGLLLARMEDSGEIERMMAEGMYGGPSCNATPAVSTPASPGPRTAAAATEAADAAAATTAPSTSADNNNNDDDDDGNIWRRLRSNVLGRVQPPPSKQPTEPTATAKPTAADKTPSANGPPPPPPSTRSRRRPADPVLGPLAGGPSHARASYERSKRAFERRHTRVTMHRVEDVEPDAAATDGGRLQTAYLDHWKLVYARVLHRWRMDAKAAEVVGCVEDPALRALLRNMYCQPHLLKDHHQQQQQQQQQLACAWCGEFVRGRALVCHACGHGGHKEHMLRWFRGAQARLARCGLVPPDDSGREKEKEADACVPPLNHELAALNAYAFDSASSDSDDDGAVQAAMPDGAPTCPAGCGCNCLFESHKLFTQ